MLEPYTSLAVRVGLILALGVGLLLGVVALMRRERRRKAWVRADPDKPWLWDGEWRTGVIRSASRGEFAAVGIMAVVWNLLSAPGLAAFYREVRAASSDPFRWLHLAFPLAGLGWMAIVLYLYRRWRKYGPCTLRMESVPGVIGGRLAGVVHVPVRVRAKDGFTLELSCVSHTAVRGKGELLHNVESLVWRRVVGLRRELLQEGSLQTALPILFHIPYGLPPTGGSTSDVTIRWRLEVRASTSGIGFLARFVVPVFVTPRSSPSFVPDESPVAGYVKPPDVAKAYARQRISRSFPSEGTVVFRLGPARRLGDALGLTVVLLLWTLGMLAVLREGVPGGAILLGVTDLYLVGCLANLLLRSFRVEASRDGLSVSKRCLGFGRTRRFPAKDVVDISVANAGSAEKTPYYAVMMKCRRSGRQRRSILLATGFAEEEVAEAMRADLLSALGRQGGSNLLQ